MAIHINVEARVVAIDTDTPRKGERFFVDTNAWVWTTYDRYSLLPQGKRPRLHQLGYSKYIKSAIQFEAELFHAALQYGEVSHVIEEKECEIASERKGRKLEAKEFRASPFDHQEVHTQIRLAWEQIKQMSKSVTVAITPEASASALARMRDDLVDAWDAYILDALPGLGLSQVITDDSDFASVPGIVVFTANPTVIRNAREQGKLLTSR